MYSISLRQLKQEMRWLKDAIFWSDSHYWTTRQPKQKRKKNSTNVRIIYLQKFNWYAFVLSKYHANSLAVFQAIPDYDAYFYKEVINRVSSFAAWCIDAQHFEAVFHQLSLMPDIEIEFVVKNVDSGLIVPEVLKPLKLTFYERGSALNANAHL